jgi:hypothetical protein
MFQRLAVGNDDFDDDIVAAGLFGFLNVTTVYITLPKTLQPNGQKQYAQMFSYTTLKKKIK